MKTATITLGSDQYEKFKYPAGELQVRFPTPALYMGINEFRIVARIQSAEDIVELALLKDAIDGLEGCDRPEVQLILPYLPYARADRRFVPGDCLGIATFGRLLFTLSFSRVVTLDAHSGVAREWINEFQEVSAQPFIELSLINFARYHNVHRLTVLYPDEGAAKRYKLPAQVGSNVEQVELDFLYCEKKREAGTGKFLGFKVPDLPQQPAIIVDDICDGGGTFLGIAKLVGGRPLGLYVTHGIFSKGLKELNQYFERIYCTDSFRADWKFGMMLEVWSCLPELARSAAVGRE